nr:hypothetical protein [Tanacetum cinerariifolium]
MSSARIKRIVIGQITNAAKAVAVYEAKTYESYPTTTNVCCASLDRALWNALTIGELAIRVEIVGHHFDNNLEATMENLEPEVRPPAWHLSWVMEVVEKDMGLYPLDFEASCRQFGNNGPWVYKGVASLVQGFEPVVIKVAIVIVFNIQKSLGVFDQASVNRLLFTYGTLHMPTYVDAIIKVYLHGFITLAIQIQLEEAIGFIKENTQKTCFT